ncbi:MAG: hypothetical protein WCK34_09540, partial [Bacteroidota bacterium]
FPEGNRGYRVDITANYPLEWGLGSSSTLCYLVAGWAGINAFDLHKSISTGSGYDIACAGRSEALFYSLEEGKPVVSPATAGKALREYSYFVFLGNKQDTAFEVNRFSAATSHSQEDVERVSRLADLICEAGTFDDLRRLTDEHESVMSRILKREPVSRRFPLFPGTVKSLGAWGGDFAMFVSGKEPREVIDILHGQGFPVVFTYDQIKAAP